ncbi:hypothetical protein BDR07DRAFT_1493116 [Suillus spraguei]|nr:hypothetical protein BDR07DRAFT_1493116 [Suillus spraguei]
MICCERSRHFKLKPSSRHTGPRPKKDEMVGSQWTSPEQKDYLETQFSEFLKQQLQGTLLNFWSTVSMEFLNRWPEIDVLYPDKTLSQLSEAENVVLGKAVEARKKQIKNWFNYRSRKGGRSQLNAMTKSITKMLGNKAKGTRAHTEVENFSKLNYDTAVRSQIKEKIEAGLLVTKNKKLMAVKESTKAAYEAAPSEIRSLCKAKAAEEREAKASVMLSEATATGTPTNAQYAKALEECIGPISQFFDAVRQLTGWEWSVIGGGPDPRLGGMLNVSSYHTGMNQSGLTWKQATSNFTEKHLNPYLSYLGTVFTEEDRKKRALDYVRPAEQEETSSHQEAEAPTMSASTSLQVNLSSPARATMMPFDSPGHSRISVQGLNVFDSPGPSRIGLQGLDGPYSWGFDTSPLGQQPPRPQTPTLLPTFPSTFLSASGSWAPPLSLTSPDTPITSWRRESELWDTTRHSTLMTPLTAPLPLTEMPVFNFDSINMQEIPLPHSMSTNKLSDRVVLPAAPTTDAPVLPAAPTTDAPGGQIETTTDTPPAATTTNAPPAATTMNAPPTATTTNAPPTATTTNAPPAASITDAPPAASPATTTDAPTAQRVVRPTATTMDAPGGQIKVQAEGVGQKCLQVNNPPRKTGRVRQESTRMAQANMIGGSAKRLRTGEAENAVQKKKRKSGT